jgi:predicted ATPase
MMRLLALNGQRGAALVQYEKCRQVLAEELDVEPAVETTALYEQIRDGDLSGGVGEQRSRGDLATPLRRRSVTPSNHNLPSQLTPFIGRKDELAAITCRLQDPACRLLTLVGPGGIGKTRLAIQAAQNLIDIQSKGIAFAHGVIFVPLSPVSSPGSLISAIAEAADFGFYSDVSPRQQLLDYLREKEMLLVLDNFETDADLITEILATAPAVRILVTSREALNLQEAWFHPVDGMSFPKEGMGEGKALEEYDAIRLFVQSACRAQVGFSLAAKQQSVARICRLVEGIPLAIELAAAWLKVLSCDEIAREIEHSLDFLATQHTNVPERHRSMRAVFEHSWRLLAEAEQDVLKRLSVFRGGFRQDAAESVAGASLIILKTLVEKSLLRPTDTGRYQMHELLRQFAAEKIESDSVEKQSTQARHSRYYLTFLQVQEQSLKGEQQQTALVEIGKEIENVRTGWNWAVEQGQVDAIDRALESLYNFYQIRGRYQEGGETFGYAVQHVRGLNNQANPQKFKTLQAKILARWGAFDASLGFTEPAKERLQKSLAIVQELGHQQEIAFCLDFLGRVAGWQGHYARARQLLQESLSISKAIDEREGMAITMNNLAEVVQFLGEYSEAKRLAQDSLDISCELGRRDWIAYALDRLGFNTFILGEYAESEQCYQESLAIFKELGDQLGISLTLIAPGLIAWATGGANLVEAETLAQKSLAVARECGHRFHIATRLGLLGLIVSDSGRLEDARQIYQEGLTISRALDAAVPMMHCLSGLGDVNRQLGNLQASKKYLLKALKTSVNAGLPAYTLQALVYYAALLLQESDVLEKRPAVKRQKQIQALELVALTLHHPACWQAFKERAARLRTKLEAELASKVAAATWERGKSRMLEDVVSEMWGLKGAR